MFNCSAAEGSRFQSEVTRISDIIARLGNNPIKKLLSSTNKEKESSGNKEKDKTD